MRKVAVVFPGQGSQYVGMGKDLFEEFFIVKDVFREADNILNYKLSEICFNGPKDKLCDTYISQVAIVTLSMAILKLLKSFGIGYEMAAGLSLGEYSALMTTGAINFNDGLKIVQQRGRYMQEASQNTEGAMAAIIGGDLEVISEVCSILKENGIIDIANYNSPAQVVISGEATLIDEAISMLNKKGIKRCIKLSVSGAFHTKLMESASIKLRELLEDVNFNDINEGFVSNVKGEVIKDCKELKDLLKDQVISPVLWEKSVETMINEGINTFIEVGPGKALSGFIKKINKDVNVLNVQDRDSLIKTLEFLDINI